MQDTPTRVRRYEILRELGRGGMAVVYLARQLDLERFVALKELKEIDTSDRSMVLRFLREAKVAGSLSHPNVVTVLDYLEQDGIPYIAMEYVECGSLRPHIGSLTPAQFTGVLEGVLAGLTAAEQRNIVHRDLKPENLMVTSDGRIKIADFGIAKATTKVQTGAFRTETGITVGTPHYMAPEQAMGQDVGPWTDLYSLGCVAFEMLTRNVPFHDSDAPMAVLLRHVNEQIPPVKALDASADQRISDWIERLLKKDPSTRTRSATEAWDQLEEIVISTLGPRWRREARLTARASEMTPPTPLTPAPFASAKSDSAGRSDAADWSVHRSSGSHRRFAPIRPDVANRAGGAAPDATYATYDAPPLARPPSRTTASDLEGLLPPSASQPLRLATAEAPETARPPHTQRTHTHRQKVDAPPRSASADEGARSRATRPPQGMNRREPAFTTSPDRSQSADAYGVPSARSSAQKTIAIAVTVVFAVIAAGSALVVLGPDRSSESHTANKPERHTYRSESYSVTLPASWHRECKEAVGTCGHVNLQSGVRRSAFVDDTGSLALTIDHAPRAPGNRETIAVRLKDIRRDHQRLLKNYRIVARWTGSKHFGRHKGRELGFTSQEPGFAAGVVCAVKIRGVIYVITGVAEDIDAIREIAESATSSLAPRRGGEQ